MKYELELKEYTLKEFIERQDVTHGLIIGQGAGFTYQYTAKYFALKLECKDNIVFITFKTINSHKSPINFDDISFTDTRNTMTIDYKNKIIISDMPVVLDNFNGFTIRTLLDVGNEIESEFIESYTKLLDIKFAELMKNPICSETYNKTRNRSIKDKELLYLREKYAPVVYANRIIDRDKIPNNISLYHNYLIDRSSINSAVLDFYNNERSLLDGNYRCHSISYYIIEKAKKEMMEEMENNLSDNLKLKIKVMEALESAGKTIVLELKDGTNIKAEPRFHDYSYFRTVIGWNSIELDNIKAIKFNGKVLLDLEQFTSEKENK